MLKTLDEFQKQIEQTKKSFEKYNKAKDTYESLEFDEFNSFDFKTEYGANNDKIRKEHIKRKFKKEYEKMKNLENEYLNNQRLCDYYKLKSEALIKIL